MDRENKRKHDVVYLMSLQTEKKNGFEVWNEGLEYNMKNKENLIKW